MSGKVNIKPRAFLKELREHGVRYDVGTSRSREQVRIHLDGAVLDMHTSSRQVHPRVVQQVRRFVRNRDKMKLQQKPPCPDGMLPAGSTCPECGGLRIFRRGVWSHKAGVTR